MERLPSIEEANRLDREAFLDALGLLFEGRTPLVERLFARRPFTSYEALLEEARAACAALSEEQKREVLNAHPRIGAPREELRRRSRLSFAEQGYGRERAQESTTESAVSRAMARLNESYETRFGFRFVVFVKGRSRAALLPVLRARLSRRPEEELETGLSELLAIAYDRWTRLASTLE